ncbi:uncharacterized protein LOC113161041 [Anabas testudineus]|uniref:uncharacterized protein LOC113161041 n=1 Tax=Anabas testudineus TaxID=64144 RepID=UPI000E45AE39|nr:uncharacterized protein LOC113161041 [Anabas testudineus]XP_026214319.1 uncharacterized protein LOC113161041 [Anabas testudineus]
MGRSQQSPLQTAAMSVLVLLLTMMTLMVMKSEAALAQIVTVSENSAETILNPLGLQMGTKEHEWDVRWNHNKQLLSLKTNNTKCHHGRCELLRNGSLRFSRVQTEDAGNYSMEVFFENGTRLIRRDFVLRVQAAGTSVGVSMSVSCLLLFLLLVIIIIIFMLRRRRMKMTNTSGQVEENVYVRMHSCHGKEGTDYDDETRQGKEEESAYVSCHPAVSTKTPITKKASAEGDDIYV